MVDPRFPVEVTQLDLNLAGTHWQIQGGSQGRPPRGPNSFIFMQAKIIGYHTHFESWRPPPENPGSATGYYWWMQDFLERHCIFASISRKFYKDRCTPRLRNPGFPTSEERHFLPKPKMSDADLFPS